MLLGPRLPWCDKDLPIVELVCRLKDLSCSGRFSSRPNHQSWMLWPERSCYNFWRPKKVVCPSENGVRKVIQQSQQFPPPFFFLICITCFTYRLLNTWITIDIACQMLCYVRKTLQNTTYPRDGKLAPQWEGPYRIAEVVGQGAYQLRSIDEQDVRRSWNAMHLDRKSVV